jgi:hypothetical protein
LHICPLIEGEAARRESRTIERRIKNARFTIGRRKTFSGTGTGLEDLVRELPLLRDRHVFIAQNCSPDLGTVLAQLHCWVSLRRKRFPALQLWPGRQQHQDFRAIQMTPSGHAIGTHWYKLAQERDPI